MDSRPFDANEISCALDALADCEHISPQYVQYRRDIFRAQVETFHHLRRTGDQLTLSAASAEDGTSSPVIDWDCLQIDRALASQLLHSLLDAQVNAPAGRMMPSVLEDFTRDPGLLTAFAREVATRPHEAIRAHDITEDAAVTLFLVRAVCAPFAAHAVEVFQRRGLNAFDRDGLCGWCGSQPGLAQLHREDGKRVLICSLCGNKWQFPRTGCPFCGRSGTLEILSFETADPWSIEACDDCRFYLKTMDERRTPADEPTIPLIASIATLYLDLIAESESLIQPPPYVAIR